MSRCHHVLLLAHTQLWQPTRRDADCYHRDTGEKPRADATFKIPPNQPGEALTDKASQAHALCERGAWRAGCGPMATWAGTWPRDPISAPRGTRGWRSGAARGRQGSEDLAGEWGSAPVRQSGADRSDRSVSTHLLAPHGARAGESTMIMYGRHLQDAFITTSIRFPRQCV